MAWPAGIASYESSLGKVFLMPDTLRISRLVHERFFHRFRVSINHRQVGADNFRLTIFD
jgi:hypothetical protein